MRTAFVTGADRGLGLSLVRQLAEREAWHIFAGSYLNDWDELPKLQALYPDRITVIPLDIGSANSVNTAMQWLKESCSQLDLLINNAGVSSQLKDSNILMKQDYNDLLRLYNINTWGALRMVRTFLPLLSRSSLKRLCFISSEAGSINHCRREAWYGYCMSKAALNMAVKQLCFRLRPEGYTFRLFHPGWMKTYMSGQKNTDAELEPNEVAKKALDDFLGEHENGRDKNENEDRLVMRDWSGAEWAW